MRSALSPGNFRKTGRGALPPFLPSEKLLSTLWSRAPQISTPKCFQGLRMVVWSSGDLGAERKSFWKAYMSFKVISSMVTFNI